MTLQPDREAACPVYLFSQLGGLMRNIIISLILWCGVASAHAAITAGDLSEGAPDRYVVVRGDTLWAISGQFLKDPWRWPELWKNNEDQIKNPNLIYPGDVLILDRSAQEIRLRLLQSDTIKLMPGVTEAPLAPEPVPMISGADIGPFLSQPLVVGEKELDSAPQIIATEEDRIALGNGGIAYAEGITQDKGDFWQVFRRGDALIDPDTKQTLGYQAKYLGDVRVNKFGAVSTLEIVKSSEEIYVGDKLVAASRASPIVDYFPHAPTGNISGRIIHIYNSLFETGPSSIVVLNRGAREGIEVGHVLAIYRDLNSPTYQLRDSAVIGGYRNQPLGDRNSPIFGRIGPTGSPKPAEKSAKPTLPDTRYGLLMVFRVFENVSYALVMNADRPVSLLDTVTTP
jgi:hypothetical protein